MPVPWTAAPALRIDADLPPEQRFATIEPPLLAAARELVAAISQHLPSSYPHLARLVALRTGGRFTAEAKALAERVGVDWQRVLVANITYDLVLATLGCSTVALATPDGPVLARNMDWMPEAPLARASVRIDTFRNGRLLHSNASWPGGIGVVTGLSSKGFAVALNAVTHPDAPDRLGYPVLLHLRRVLDDATGFDDALLRLQTVRLASPGLFTLVGRENRQRVVVERSPRAAALRWPEAQQPLVATNHYQALVAGDAPSGFGLAGSSAGRCAMLGRLVSGTAAAPISDEHLLFALTDPAVLQGITAQHVIARPAAETLQLYVPTRLLTEETAD